MPNKKANQGAKKNDKNVKPKRRGSVSPGKKSNASSGKGAGKRSKSEGTKHKPEKHKPEKHKPDKHQPEKHKSEKPKKEDPKIQVLYDSANRNAKPKSQEKENNVVNLTINDLHLKLDEILPKDSLYVQGLKSEIMKCSKGCLVPKDEHPDRDEYVKDLKRELIENKLRGVEDNLKIIDKLKKEIQDYRMESEKLALKELPKTACDCCDSCCKICNVGDHTDAPKHGPEKGKGKDKKEKEKSVASPSSKGTKKKGNEKELDKNFEESLRDADKLLEKVRKTVENLRSGVEDSPEPKYKDGDVITPDFALDIKAITQLLPNLDKVCNNPGCAEPFEVEESSKFIDRATSPICINKELETVHVLTTEIKSNIENIKENRNIIHQLQDELEEAKKDMGFCSICLVRDKLEDELRRRKDIMEQQTSNHVCEPNEKQCKICNNVRRLEKELEEVGNIFCPDHSVYIPLMKMQKLDNNLEQTKILNQIKIEMGIKKELDQQVQKVKELEQQLLAAKIVSEQKEEVLNHQLGEETLKVNELLTKQKHQIHIAEREKQHLCPSDGRICSSCNIRDKIFTKLKEVGENVYTTANKKLMMQTLPPVNIPMPLSVQRQQMQISPEEASLSESFRQVHLEHVVHIPNEEEKVRIFRSYQVESVVSKQEVSVPELTTQQPDLCIDKNTEMLHQTFLETERTLSCGDNKRIPYIKSIVSNYAYQNPYEFLEKSLREPEKSPSALGLTRNAFTQVTSAEILDEVKFGTITDGCRTNAIQVDLSEEELQKAMDMYLNSDVDSGELLNFCEQGLAVSKDLGRQSGMVGSIHQSVGSENKSSDPDHASENQSDQTEEDLKSYKTPSEKSERSEKLKVEEQRVSKIDFDVKSSLSGKGKESHVEETKRDREQSTASGRSEEMNTMDFEVFEHVEDPFNEDIPIHRKGSDLKSDGKALPLLPITLRKSSKSVKPDDTVLFVHVEPVNLPEKPTTSPEKTDAKTEIFEAAYTKWKDITLNSSNEKAEPHKETQSAQLFLESEPKMKMSQSCRNEIFKSLPKVGKFGSDSKNRISALDHTKRGLPFGPCLTQTPLIEHSPISSIQEETMSEGEVKCRCSVSSGEYHKCPYEKKIKANIDGILSHYKTRPEKMFRDALKHRLTSAKQKQRFDHWLSTRVKHKIEASDSDTSSNSNVC